MPFPFFWARATSVFSSFVVELTAEFLSHVMQSFCKFPILASKRLQLSGEIPQFFLLLQNAVLLSVRELVELKNLKPGSSPKSECGLTHKPQSCQANQQHQTESQQDQGHWTPSRRRTLVLCMAKLWPLGCSRGLRMQAHRGVSISIQHVPRAAVLGQHLDSCTGDRGLWLDFPE